jgi:myo-inositol-1(or 4)-monophosphatase
MEKTLDANLAALHTEIIKVVKEAGHFIKVHFGTVRVEEIDDKDHNSLVSYVDKGAEEILVLGLSKLLPDAGFITEEGMTAQGQKALTWIIDPLDGTTNFLYNIPNFAVSIALYDGRQILMGYVYDVMVDNLYHAHLGGGAYCNDKPISVSKENGLAQMVIATGFPYKATDVRPGHLVVLDHIIKHTRGLRRLGAAALDLCYVASGRFGAFYEHTLNPWDIAGGAIIVQEAGGVITDMTGGDDYLWNGYVVACAPQVQKEMLAIVAHF